MSTLLKGQPIHQRSTRLDQLIDEKKETKAEIERLMSEIRQYQEKEMPGFAKMTELILERKIHRYQVLKDTIEANT
jgi:hypothetical protein